ncbi:MAG: hypothetical protein H6659_14605 [Ardenticatenaceae bacterium]|nr:hypothetical protein [Ardenticatenaceae bacterium]
MSKIKIWRISLLAGLMAGIIVEFCVILILFAHYQITGQMLSGEGSVDMGVAFIIGPVMSLIVGVITIFAVKNYLTHNTSGT